MNIIKAIWKGARAWLITTVAVVVLVLAVTLVATQNAFIYSTINSVLGGEKSKVISGDPSEYMYYEADVENFGYFEPTTELKTKEDALTDANKLNEKIAEEGITLLKNEDDALPLAKGAKISVFGKNSVDIVYGGAGGGRRAGVASTGLDNGVERGGVAGKRTIRRLL